MENSLVDLERIVSNQPGLQVVLHNDPDPDAIASGLGMQHLLRQAWGIETAVLYDGIVGRAENRALVRYLESPLQRFTADHATRPSILVDTQPGAGNNPFLSPEHVVVVVDHHTLLPETAEVPYTDVRPELGATSSIIAGYMIALDLLIPTEIATALYYGIKSDTLCLARGASERDLLALMHLQPLVNQTALIQIEQAQVPFEYFRAFHQALESATIFGPVLFAYIGEMAYPDWAAEMADWFLRLDSVQWVVCVGQYGEKLYLSIRTRDLKGGAGRVARAVIGRDGFAGGHGLAAGGQLPLRGQDGRELAGQLRERALRRLKVAEGTEARRLL